MTGARTGKSACATVAPRQVGVPRKSEMAVKEVSGPVSSLRVLIAAGGTGGHIFPALEIAYELRARAADRACSDCAVEFLGAGRDLEFQLIERAGFPLRVVPAGGLKGIKGSRRVRNLLLLPRSFLRTKALLRNFDPNVVVGTGGYLAGPPLLEAALMGIPTLLIEPNFVPGFTNRVLAPVVRIAAVAFPETAEHFGAKGRVTGVPVRKAVASVPAKEHVPPLTLLVLGGSQGSKAINECMVKALPRLSKETPSLGIIHQTGERDYNDVKEAYATLGIAAEVCAFIENMADVLSRADLVVARAGAMTVAELAAAGRAALLVPFPVATDNHQLENARALERAGAARVIEQAELRPGRVLEEVHALLAAPRRLTEMERSARALARPDAAKRIADLVEELAARKV